VLVYFLQAAVALEHRGAARVLVTRLECVAHVSILMTFKHAQRASRAIRETPRFCWATVRPRARSTRMRWRQPARSASAPNLP
jgi:hypothetical protein